jgi:hypothetical protein
LAYAILSIAISMFFIRFIFFSQNTNVMWYYFL